VLSARDQRDVAAVAADLSTRWGIEATPLVLDLGATEVNPDAFIEEALAALGHLEIAVVTAGVVDDRDGVLAEPEVIAHVGHVNFLSAIQLLGAFARLFHRGSAGHIVAISSIAAAAPRGRNIVYSASKAGLEVFCKGLRHGLQDSGVTIQVFALGYVDTRLAFGQRLLLPAASPDRVARYIMRKLGKSQRLRYYPRFWGLVVRVIRLLPMWVRLRMNY
jgi:hypothetical protein